MKTINDLVTWILSSVSVILLGFTVFFLKNMYKTIYDLGKKMGDALVHIARDRSDIDNLIVKSTNHENELKNLGGRVTENEKDIIKLKK